MLIFLLFAYQESSQAINVAVMGGNSNTEIVSYLNANGFSATDYGYSVPSATILANFQAVVLLRMDGNNDLKNWVNNGGLLITEYSAAAWAAANVITATVSSSGLIGTGTAITFSGSTLGLKLSTGLPNPYSDGGSTEFFYTFSSIGVGVEILATRPTNIAAIIGAAYGSGYTFVIAYDWADGFPATSTNNGILLKNALNSGATGPLTPPANPTSVSATYTELCNGTSTLLTANGAVGTVYWFTGSCGGVATSPATGSTLTVSPSVTTTYYARNYNNSQFSVGCAAITITVNPLLQYRSAQSGNWTTLANWQQYNGSGWVTATSYPGQTSNNCSNPMVTIRANHLMEIQNGSTIAFPKLKVETTGKLTVKQGGKLLVNDQLLLDQNAAGAIVRD